MCEMIQNWPVKTGAEVSFLYSKRAAEYHVLGLGRVVGVAADGCLKILQMKPILSRRRAAGEGLVDKTKA